MVSHELGIPVDQIKVSHGDTSESTMGVGTFGSRGLVALMNTITRPAFVLVLSKKAVAKLGVSPNAPLAERAKALKGLKIALSGLNNVSHTFLNYALAKGGLKQSDIQIVKTAPPSMYAALKKGDVDGFWANGMGAETAIRAGVRVSRRA